MNRRRSPAWKGLAFFLQKEKERPFDWKMTVGKDDLFGLDQELRGFPGAMGDTVNDPFDGDSIKSDESGDVGRRMGRMKVEMDGKDSESEEKEEDDPGAPAGSFQDHQEEPETEEDQKRKDQGLRGRRQVQTGPNRFRRYRQLKRE